MNKLTSNKKNRNEKSADKVNYYPYSSECMCYLPHENVMNGLIVQSSGGWCSFQRILYSTALNNLQRTVGKGVKASVCEYMCVLVRMMSIPGTCNVSLFSRGYSLCGENDVGWIGDGSSGQVILQREMINKCNEIVQAFCSITITS